MTREAECWWNRISGAKNLLDAVTDTVLSEQNVAIHHGNSSGWLTEFREMIRDKIHELAGLRSFVAIDADDIGDNLGKYLFENMCSEETKTRYSARKGYAAFLAEECMTGLRESYVWVYNIHDKNRDEKYADFVMEYNNTETGRSKAVFILESQYKGKKKRKKNIKTLEQESEITKYDMALFALEFLGDKKLNEKIREYVAELAAGLSGSDPELCVALIEETEALLEDPEVTAERILNQRNSSCSKEDQEKIIWEAQVKIFYPIIEQERMKLVGKYKKQIAINLPAQMPFGETIEETDMVELGMLKSMKDTGKVQMDTRDFQYTDVLWSARNRLAHIKLLERLDFIKN